ncbi:MAG TPA: hypothetical protein VMS65_11530 [Polyangiaceae bacterium]|nr:hypothetical protein [Polyangiaceae bacterium]
MTEENPLVVTTRTAHMGWDEHRYFGRAVFADLTGKESLTYLVALSILGRELPRDCYPVLDDAACALTLADPRIWPLKLTRLVASYGSTVPATAAGLLIEERARVGPWACAKAAEVLTSFEARIAGRASEPAHVRSVVKTYLAEHRFVWGFGTPFRARDERLIAFGGCIAQRGKSEGRYWRALGLVADEIREARGTEPNIGMAIAAAFLDMGMTPREVGAMATALMQHMFFAHAVEGAGDSGHALKLLPDECVSYVGREPRSSPRAAPHLTSGRA